MGRLRVLQLMLYQLFTVSLQNDGGWSYCANMRPMVPDGPDGTNKRSVVGVHVMTDKWRECPDKTMNIVFKCVLMLILLVFITSSSPS